MTIKKAVVEQYPAVREFFHTVIDAIGDSRDSVEWKKDVYPSPSFLLGSIERGELYIAFEEETIIGAMVLNHEGNDAYGSCPWPTEADDAEVVVIHALAVHPSFRRTGCGKQMVRFAADHARTQHQKAIRLDVLKGNVLAEKLYTGLGFLKLQTVPMFYEDTGWKEFDLYEYRL